jgi:hypothetical protein
MAKKADEPRVLKVDRFQLSDGAWIEEGTAVVKAFGTAKKDRFAKLRKRTGARVIITLSK